MTEQPQPNQTGQPGGDEPVSPGGGQENQARMEPLLPKTRLLELNSNTASFICYIPVVPVNLLFGVLWLVTEPKAHGFVRFHAMQSLILGGGFFLLNIISYVLTLALSIVPFLGFIAGMFNFFMMIVTLAFIGVSIKCMIDAHKGRTSKLLFVGDIAEQLM